MPIRQGQVDFKDATVEHVGPDSRMGVSRLGLYVDAPNGRSYLYQFPSAPVAGVEYERRGALLGPFVTDRGNLRLQEFGEWLLRKPGGQPWASPGKRGCFSTAQRFPATCNSATGGSPHPACKPTWRDAPMAATWSVFTRKPSAAGCPGNGFTVGPGRGIAFRGHANELRGRGGGAHAPLSVEDTRLRFAFDLTNMKLSGLRLATAPQAPRAA